MASWIFSLHWFMLWAVALRHKGIKWTDADIDSFPGTCKLKLCSKLKYLYPGKCIWKCSTWSGCHFDPAPMCWNATEGAEKGRGLSVMILLKRYRGLLENSFLSKVVTHRLHVSDIICVHHFFRLQRAETLRPRQNGRHFADDRFRCICLNEVFEFKKEIP